MKKGGNAKPTSINKKKSLDDYVFYVGSAKQAADYESAAEYVINHIKRTFERGHDIAEALRTGTLPDLNTWNPQLQISRSTDDEVKQMENEQFKMLYKAELDDAIKRKRIFEENKFKAYALIWERCAKSMQSKISTRTDYQTDIFDNPIRLLNAIKEHSLHYQDKKYPISIIVDAFRAIFSAKQKENESLLDFTRRFKTAKDVLESHLGGSLYLEKYIRALPNYDAVDERAAAKTGSEHFYAYLYLENVDYKKYGSLTQNLNQQYTLNNDQYPKTIGDANNVLSNHKFDNFKPKVHNKNKKEEEASDKNENEQEDQPVKLSFAQMEGKCYTCGKSGHRSPKCPMKGKIPREEWAINKAQMMQQNGSDDTKANSSSTKENDKDGHVGWAGVHCSFAHGENLKEFILLDSDSTDTVFCNSKYVTNIRDSNEVLRLNTNGGVLEVNKKCDVPHLGTHWFSDNAITNVISLAHMADKFRVTYDSDKEKAMIVHLPNKTVKFHQMKNGLYGRNPSHEDMPQKLKAQMINTMKENEMFVTPSQLEKAKRARKLYESMGTPTTQDLKAMIRMNLIRDNIVTTKDVDLAETIFGPDVGAIKGKTTRQRPTPINDTKIEIPSELLAVNEEVELSMDGLKVNSLDFLTTITNSLFYRTAQYLTSTHAKVYGRCIDEILAVYKRGGFIVKEIHCDNEFHSVLDSFAAHQNPPISVKYAAPLEHVPRAERNNRVIKERVRSAYHRLPYVHLPRIMVKYMVMESARKLNFFPAKQGVSKHYSPRMILHHENLDYNRHCKFAFGEYVLGHDEPSPTNTQAARALDCIYLCPSSGQSGHDLLHLATNAVVNRRHCTPMPVTAQVIKQVHKLAELDKMPKGLKITNRAGTILFDSAKIAGVDYLESEDEFDSEDSEESDDDDATDSSEESSEENEEDDYMDENERAEVLYTPSTEHHRQNNHTETPFETHDDEDEQSEGVNEQQEEEQELEIEEESDSENEGVDDDEADPTYEPTPTPTEDPADETNPLQRRSTRSRAPTQRYKDFYQMHQMHLQMDENTVKEEYSVETATVIAKVISHYNSVMSNMTTKEAHAFTQSYSLKKGLKMFGDKAKQAVNKEMKQLHNRAVFKPIHVHEMTQLERKRAMESLIFLVEKRDGRIKARTCANGSTQRSYISKDEAASPTAATQAVLLTSIIEAKQGRDVMVIDAPNAFVQTDVPPQEEKIVMKIKGVLVDILLELCPGVYDDYVVYENGEKVVYVEIMKALYGMLIASLLWYKKFRADVEKIGFEINPYDVCVANSKVEGKQHTLTWHVDDIKASHVNKKVNDRFAEWCESKYGSDLNGHVQVTRGKRLDYLGMILDYSEKGILKVDMRYYIENMMAEFPEKLRSSNHKPWNDKLFRVDDTSKLLDKKRKETFHSFVMKAMFLSQRARPDIQPGVAYLSTRVKNPTESDWIKLLKVLSFLKATKEDILRLEADDTMTIKWFVDAAFAVHGDLKSHTGAVMTLGKGAVVGDSTKQKVNSRSSTESELVAVDDKISKIVWTKKFLESQGFNVKLNIIYQDNESTIKLENNGKESSGKRTRHFDIKFFYVNDLVKRGEVTIKYCPTNDMLADYMSKPLTGPKFSKFRQLIMNLACVESGSRSVLENKVTGLSHSHKMTKINGHGNE